MARDSTRTSEGVENTLQSLPSRGSDNWEFIHGLLFPKLPQGWYILQGQG